jgi:hypothetical protein
MVNKTLFASLIIILIINVSSVLAITCSIGNSRMVLRANVGDVIEKYILVKNVNDVSVVIEMNPSGDLASYIKLKENNFTLQPGEDKKAYFELKVGKNGTTETNINIQFTPVGEKGGCGLSSTLIVLAGGESLDDEVVVPDDEVPTNDTGVEPVTPPKPIKIGTVGILLILTALIFIVFIALVIVYYSKNKKDFQKIDEKKLNQKKSSRL